MASKRKTTRRKARGIMKPRLDPPPPTIVRLVTNSDIERAMAKVESACTQLRHVAAAVSLPEIDWSQS